MMMKIITETLIDAFCASMIAVFFLMGIATLIVPILSEITLWATLCSIPMFFVSFICLIILDRDNPKNILS